MSGPGHGEFIFLPSTGRKITVGLKCVENVEASRKGEEILKNR